MGKSLNVLILQNHPIKFDSKVISQIEFLVAENKCNYFQASIHYGPYKKNNEKKRRHQNLFLVKLGENKKISPLHKNFPSLFPGFLFNELFHTENEITVI